MSDLTKLSKTMSYLLRHDPAAGGMTLDVGGWTPLDDLINGLKTMGHAAKRQDILEIVAADTKGRFSISHGGWKGRERIRANQGHSVKVEMDFERAVPPDVLYHGTVQRFVDDIFCLGLQKMARHHVHLSGDVETATKVGARRGKPVVLAVDAKAMHAEGHEFFRSENNVWLVAHVPPRFLSRR